MRERKSLSGFFLTGRKFWPQLVKNSLGDTGTGATDAAFSRHIVRLASGLSNLQMLTGLTALTILEKIELVSSGR